ncbi:MAG: VTT domain-containing protein [Cytophagales bacterium]
MSRRKKEAFKFFTKNLLQGIVWFALILLVLWLGAKYLPDDIKNWLTPLRERPFLVYSIFFASEVIFGIIPPEIFMVWALDQGVIYYMQVIMLLTVLSYAGGIIAYFIGRFFSNTAIFRHFKKSESYYNYSRTYRRFGGILILIAAVTPLPFALISMISGSFSYSFRMYLRFAAFRILRFVVYGYFIWEGMNISF